jgi:hypothetical protein
MTESPHSINPAEDLYDLAALHCIVLPAEGSDRDRALAAAADCFHLANWWPGEADVAEQFLALAALLPADAQSESDNCPTHSPPPRSDEFVRPTRRQRQPRQPSIRKLIEQAKNAGASITMPDGTKLDFSKPESAASENPWLDDLKVTKQ